VSLITIGESGEEVVHLSFSLPEGFDRYSKSVEFHTAGYDAFVTGQIFAYFRAVLGGERIEDFSNRVYLMFSAFQLELSRQSDRLMFDGVVRYLCHVSASIGGSRGLEQLLRPLTQEGDRRAEFRWIGQDSLLLVLHGGDAAAGAPGREACEEALDALLRREAQEGALRFAPLEAHLQAVSGVAVTLGGREGAEEEPPAKRPRPV